MRKQMTQTQKKDILAAIEFERAKGYSVKYACKANGISDPTYYQWRKEVDAEPVTPATPNPVTVVNTGKVCLLYGDVKVWGNAQEIATVLKNLV